MKLKICYFSFLLLVLNTFESALRAHSDDQFSEFFTGATFLTGDSLRSTTGVSASAVYHLNRAFWFGLESFYLPISKDRTSSVNATDGSKFLGVAPTVYLNLPGFLAVDKAASALNGWKVDLYTSLGVGPLAIDRDTLPFGFIGGGLLFHLPAEILLLKCDLKNLFYVYENPGGGDFNSDLGLSLGIAIAI